MFFVFFKFETVKYDKLQWAVWIIRYFTHLFQSSSPVHSKLQLLD